MKRRTLLIFSMAAALALIFVAWGAVFAAPVLTNNNVLAINKGDTDSTITSAELLAEDVAATPDLIFFIVESTPANGTLRRSGTELAVNDSFTQQDIDNNLITYDHNDSLTNSDSFNFSITGEDPAATHTFNISVNLPPVTMPDTIAVLEGGLASQTTDGTGVADNDSDPEGQTLTVTASPVVSPLYVDTASASYPFTLGPSGSFDYKHDDSENLSDSFVYEICDPGGLCTQETVTINITGVVDIDPVLNSAGPFTISESSGNGPTGDTLTAVDEEVTVGGYDSLTYTITDGDPETAFGIDDSSGVTGAFLISNRNKLDFETTDTYTLTIEVKDESNAFDTGQVIVNITDANDAPVITPGQSFNVPENSNNGTEVGDVAATDADAADAGNLTFAITDGNTSSAFAIDNNGKLTVNNKNALNFENKSSFTLEITVTDSGWD
ncbi:MAG: cadherin domain-containing protein, partial [Anaerolineales bacterium]|nr:cadherin domain-containing protein [Anaerolineales bacterium]